MPPVVSAPRLVSSVWLNDELANLENAHGAGSAIESGSRLLITIDLDTGDVPSGEVRRIFGEAVKAAFKDAAPVDLSELEEQVS